MVPPTRATPVARMRRRDLLAIATAAWIGCSHRRPGADLGVGDDPDLTQATVASLRESLEKGQLTARSLCEAMLERIREIDASGPSLNSVIEVNSEALADADRLDAERSEGRIRSPLHGIPAMLKDNIDTADSMETTAGSLALVGSGVEMDSTVAAKMREAGMVLIAKTNLSEWANFRSRRSTSGWSGRGGLTLNPYFLARNPCGSSSGSGVAVSAGLAPLAIGTETNGSIVCPSSVNGIVGVKPTVGLVSRAGVIPISHTQDTAGPMARSVADAAALLSVLAGPDGRDEATETSNGRLAKDYTQFLDERALQGARVGLLREYWGQHRQIDGLLDDAVSAMRDAGAEVLDIDELPGIAEARRPGLEVMLYEFKHGLNAYLGGLGPDAKVRSLSGVIRFNEEHRHDEMPYFGQDILEEAMTKGPLSEPAYTEALAISRDGCRRAIDSTMDELALDAFFAPTTGPAWVTDLVHGDQSSFRGCSSAAARAGYPHITVPGGLVQGLPVGVSFFGRAWSEPRLLGIAHAFEQATKHRHLPKMLPGSGLQGADPDPSGLPSAAY